MRTIIAGSRTITGHHAYSLIKDAIKTKIGWKITKIVSGGAHGVDTEAIRYAVDNKMLFETFPANWNKYGKGAGVIRNLQMAKYADALLAIWDGQSRGTKHMIETAIKKGLLIYVVNLSKPKENVGSDK